MLSKSASSRRLAKESYAAALASLPAPYAPPFVWAAVYILQQ